MENRDDAQQLAPAERDVSRAVMPINHKLGDHEWPTANPSI